MANKFNPNLNIEDLYQDYVDIDNPENPVGMEDLLDQMDAVFNTTAKKRNLLIDKAMDAASRVYIDPAVDDVDDIGKKISILNQASALISDAEKSFTQRINTRLKYKEATTDSAMSQATIEILKRVMISDVSKLRRDLPNEGEEKAKLSKLTESVDDILDGELLTNNTDVPDVDTVI